MPCRGPHQKRLRAWDPELKPRRRYELLTAMTGVYVAGCVLLYGPPTLPSAPVKSQLALYLMLCLIKVGPICTQIVPRGYCFK